MCCAAMRDLGGEKTADCLDLGTDPNPAIGYRGIRVSLDKEEVFKTQLRAILRASAFGNLSIMFPMITSIEEVKLAKLMLEKAKKELKKEKTSFDSDIPVGVMIEKHISVCGDMAADLDMTEYLIQIGIDELSVAPNQVLALRKKIREIQ